jgi:hypothetical protein
MKMDENNQSGNSHATQYIKSNNRGNTYDNAQRTTKEEDALNPSYSNPPLGNKSGESTIDAGEKGGQQE